MAERTTRSPRWTGDRGQTTAKIWLFLLKAGGRWLTGDVAQSMKLDPSLVGWLLAAMARSGNARQFPVPGKARRFTYGVTGECRVPRCCTMQQVAECVLAEAEREEVATEEVAA